MSEQEIFAAVLEKDVDRRAAFLEEVCGTDAALRIRIDELLLHHEGAGSFFEKPAGQILGSDETVAASETLGTIIGPYKLLEQIGEGGFGVVFMAEQTEPVRRKVALKILKPGMDTKQVVARFEAERQALAVMEHPNIAHVFDGGRTDSGRPYFVMELVRGIPITEYGDQNHLPIRERLELFVDVCRAVQHAHQKGIIHRDLKPSNVLIASHDGTPVPKVIDFGIAKAMTGHLTDTTLFTGFAQMIGTPLYMSPEQAGQSSLDVDTRSDIYSLGVLLYELLTGTTPFDKETLSKLGYDEMRRVIREDEPPRPSTRVSTLGQAATTASTNRQCDPRRLSRQIKGELDWIVMKALEKDRNRRYETANGFAADVQRFLNDEAVQACPPSVGYRVRKFVRRNARGLATVALMGVVLLAAVGIVVASLGRLARDQAVREAVVAAEAHRTLQEIQRLQKLSRWSQALELARQTQVLVENSGDVDLCRKVGERVDDLIMLGKLDAIRLRHSRTITNRVPEQSGADDEFIRAFREYGVDVDALVADEAARIIRVKSIHMELVLALDVWTRARRVRWGPKDEGWRHLQAVAGAADPDPWRTRVRQAWGDAKQQNASALENLARASRIEELVPEWIVLLALALRDADCLDEGIALLRKAQPRHADNFWVNQELASMLAYGSPTRPSEAIRYYSAAIAVRPDYAISRLDLGNALIHTKDPDGAIVAFREGIRLQPDHLGLRHRLADLLRSRGDLAGVVAIYREAVVVGPQSHEAHNSLGAALHAKGDAVEAVGILREAVRLKPEDDVAQLNLAFALNDLGKVEEAIVAFRAVARRESGLAAVAHCHIGRALLAKGQIDQAIIEFREAIRIHGGSIDAHTNLGDALLQKGLLDESIAVFRKALRLSPNSAHAHCTLGLALKNQGKFAEALTALKRGHELGSRTPEWSQGSARWVQECQELLEMDRKLPAILQGEPYSADAGQRLLLGKLCGRYKKRHVAAARFYESAFGEDPKAADDLDAAYRYAAACSAALAGVGQGEDAAALTEEQRSGWRGKACAWLQADLSAWTEKLREPGSEIAWKVQRIMEHWRKDVDLAGVREVEALSRLPAEEQMQWRQLWEKAAELHRQAQTSQNHRMPNPGG